MSPEDGVERSIGGNEDVQLPIRAGHGPGGPHEAEAGLCSAKNAGDKVRPVAMGTLAGARRGNQFAQAVFRFNRPSRRRIERGFGRACRGRDRQNQVAFAVRDASGLDQPFEKPLEILPAVFRNMEMLGDHARLDRPIAGRADEIEDLLFEF